MAVFSSPRGAPADRHAAPRHLETAMRVALLTVMWIAALLIAAVLMD